MGRVLQLFEYYEPSTIGEALSLVIENDAKLLAGGCDLVPNMRNGLVRPKRIVSVMKIQRLDAVDVDPLAGLRMGVLMTIRECAGRVGASAIGRRCAMRSSSFSPTSKTW